MQHMERDVPVQDVSGSAGPDEAFQPGDVVVLSPHLDDAVLSLGALIARLAAGGRRVEVWTTYTDLPADRQVPRRWTEFGDYETRRAEDRRAMVILGAQPRHLGLPERIWRAPQPRNLAGAFRGPRTLDGFGCLPAVREVVRSLLCVPGVEVYAPLAVGQHADHLEVAVAALTVASEEKALGRIGFYEDYYALGEAFRRGHPVTRRDPRPAAPLLGSAAPALAVGLRLMAVAFRRPRLDAYVPQARELPWRCAPSPVDGFEDRKIEAVRAYASQVPRLGGARGLEAALRRAHRCRGGEPVWRPLPRDGDVRARTTEGEADRCVG
jgi:LmbE family N-acetylglucosaminyl deacetylase